MAVSLQLPSSANVTVSNAASLGYGWSAYTLTKDSESVQHPSLIAGHHVVIRFPSTYPGGTHTLTVSASGLTGASAFEATIDFQSSIQFGSAAGKTEYRPNESPTILAAAINAGQPVAGLAISGRYVARTAISAPALSNFQLIADTVSGGFRRQTYTFSAVNNGPELQFVQLESATAPTDVYVETRKLWLGRLPGNATTALGRKLMVTFPSGTTFSPSSLTWTATAGGTPTDFTLSDTGIQAAGTASDGIYATALPALPAGQYFVSLQASGTFAGALIVRNAWAEFAVVPGKFEFDGTALTETPIIGSGGKIDALRFSAMATVTQPGSYLIAATLKAANGRRVSAESRLTLGAGAQQVAVDFPARRLAQLGIDGPWTRESFDARGPDGTGLGPVAGLYGSGLTGSYSLANLNRGDFYFVGPVSAVGVDLTGNGKFDIFRVSIPVVTPGGDCAWGGRLGVVATRFDFGRASARAVLPPGATVVSIDFDGNPIGVAGQNGPYGLRDFVIECGSRRETVPDESSISGFTAAQFKNTPKGMTLVASPPTVLVPRGGSAAFTVTANSLGGLRQNAALAMPSPPVSATVTFDPVAQILMGGTRTVRVAVPAGATLGSYPAQVNASGPIASASAPVTIQVVPGTDFSLTPSSTTVTLAPSGQAVVSITVTPAVTSAGTVTFSVTGLPAGATSGFTPGSIVTSGTTTLTLSIAANTAPGSYPITVTGNNGEVVKNLPLTLVVDPLAVPFPWAVQHVGVGGAGATVSHSNGVFTLAGPGNSLNGTSDAYHSAAQTVTGDAVILARISRLQNAGKAGLMIRESAALGAPGVFFGWTSANTLTLQSRAAFNSAWVSQSTAPQTVPAWLRLQRTGNSFSASTSNDGLRWTAMGAPQSVTVASSATAAMTAVSETTGLAVSADFDHAIVSPGFYLSDPWPLTKTTNQQATFAFTAPALGGFTGSVIPSVSGLPVGATGQFAAASFAAGSGTTLTVTNTSAAAGSYPITITATSGNLTQRTYATLVISATAPAIPDPWSAQTIGTATAGSGVTFANGVNTVAGGGTGFDGIVDAFQFDATALAGDGDVSARLVSVTNPVTNGRAGVMIRDEGTANSAFAFAGALKTASGYQVEFVTRTTAGAAVTVESSPVATLPVWTRVTRAGNIFTAAWSADGISWTAFGTARTITMPSLVLAGAAVTSRDQAQLMTCAFDNLRAGGTSDFSLTLLPPGRWPQLYCSKSEFMLGSNSSLTDSSIMSRNVLNQVIRRRRTA